MSFDKSAFNADVAQIIDDLIAENPNIKLKDITTRTRIKRAIIALNKYTLAPPILANRVYKAVTSYITANGIEDDASDCTPQSSASSSATPSDSPVQTMKLAVTQTKRTSRRRPVDTSLIEQLVNERSQEINIAKTGSAKTRSHVEFCQPVITQLNIQLDDNPFKPSPRAVGAADFDLSLDCSELAAAEEQLIEFVVGKEFADQYIDANMKFSTAVQALRSKYIVHNPKKTQKFTYVDRNQRVKFFNPEKSDKLDFLPDDEARSIVEFFTGPMEAFKKAWKSSFTSSRGEQAKKFNFIGYLTLDVIRTQNIFKFEQLIKAFPSVPSESTNKITNSVLSSVKGQYVNLDEATISKIIVDRYGPDYMALFSDVKNFNGSQFQNVVKNIYSHRGGIVLHEKCTTAMKKKAWLQAYANICSLDMSEITDAHDTLIVNAWMNILSSRFAYHVIMDCIPESKLFNTAMIHLIQESTSIKLFQNVLYPISFVFTPFMLGYASLRLPKAVNVSESVYRKELSSIFMDVGNPSLRVYDYDACNWIYYMGKNGEINTMVSLLHGIVKNPKAVVKSVEKDKGSTSDAE